MTADGGEPTLLHLGRTAEMLAKQLINILRKLIFIHGQSVFGGFKIGRHLAMGKYLEALDEPYRNL
ncbi:hypothetical protein [Sphingobium sp. LF-16]|uniref:hypothetical protein n=1 Tax=Sphingobium sp. LF-16 TaxID=2185111 RepID=UPI0013DE5696|nr:hypothetical protein [Sphingobium sp. LF-16]